MGEFEEFRGELDSLVDRYRRNTPLKIEEDADHHIIKIFGEKITSISRARSGLSDVAELGYATAEHHPYWKLLNSCTEAADTVLERWDGTLSKDDISDLRWAAAEINRILDRMEGQHR